MEKVSPSELVAGSKFVNDDGLVCLVHSSIWEENKKRWIIVYATEAMISEVMMYVYEGDTVEVIE